MRIYEFECYYFVSSAGCGTVAVNAMREAAFWYSPETQRKLRGLVPEYRLSRFKEVLSDALQTEVMGSYSLDVYSVLNPLRWATLCCSR